MSVRFPARPGSRRAKRVDPFYKSQEWLALRGAVLRRHGRRCGVCGSTAGQMHVDHIRSRRTHPEAALDPTNLVVLCQSCHSRKTAQQEGGFGNRQKAAPAGCDANGEPLGRREHW